MRALSRLLRSRASAEEAELLLNDERFWADLTQEEASRGVCEQLLINVLRLPHLASVTAQRNLLKATMGVPAGIVSTDHVAQLLRNGLLGMTDDEIKLDCADPALAEALRQTIARGHGRIQA